MFEFIKKLFKTRDKPTNFYQYSGYPFLFGTSSSGKKVNEFSALQISAVFACVRILAESIASLPLHVYQYENGKSKSKATKHSLFTLLHDAPNDEMTSFNFREVLMTHLLLYGNAYAQIIRDGLNRVIALYPLLPNRMSIKRDDDGKLYYTYTRTIKDGTKTKTGSVDLRREEVLHIVGLGFDGLIGYSPIAMMKNTLGISLSMEEFQSKFYTNNARPSGVLETAGVIKNPERLRESWNEVYGGTQNVGKVAVLEEGVTFKPISISPEDAQLLESRKFQINEICRIFRVPPHMVADLERSTFSNIEQQSLEFVKFTLAPWISRIEQAMQKSLLSASERNRYFIQFNVDGLLRGDYKSRMEGYAIGRQNGWLSANDVRTLEDMNLIPASEGGDDYLINGNMTKLKDAGIFASKGGGGNEQ